MNPHLAIIMTIVAALVGAAVGYAIGYHDGKRTGRSVGWLEHYEFRERLNKTRRDRSGRFVAVKAKTEAGI
jgi:membrane protein DedA with SNARE-associated domain